MQAPAPERWCLVLIAQAGEVPAAVRLRRLLKHLKRVWGLECVEILNDAPRHYDAVELEEGRE